MEPPAPSQPALPADSILIKTLTKTQLFAIRRAQEDHNAAGARFQQSGTVLREILVDCGLDPAIPCQVHDDGSVTIPKAALAALGPPNPASRRAAAKNAAAPAAAADEKAAE